MPFKKCILESDDFMFTLELVPGREARGQTVDNVVQLAADAAGDGRISAVSMTDNPGGNPSLSPDALGRELLDIGIDVIVHVTCRDLNRAAIESRALQLARLGVHNVLALTGDFAGEAFGGQGAPVFDLDAVSLTCLLTMLEERLGDEAPFVGCAVSPFKSTEAECYAQYYKLRRKTCVGACYVITQVGYDARKFQEVLQVQRDWHISVPTLGSVYHLTARAARAMNRGVVPGVVVTDALLETVQREWRDKEAGRKAAIERSASLGAVIKGLGYRGMHLGGIRRDFNTVVRIIDRMAEIEDDWRDLLPAFDFPQPGGFYLYEKDDDSRLSSDRPTVRKAKTPLWDRPLFHLMRLFHRLFFMFDGPTSRIAAAVAALLDRSKVGRFLAHAAEDPVKGILLSCRRCGDCAIQHVAFLCPESQCPKHMRNGACGGGSNGYCEVHDDQQCVWVRAYHRWACTGETDLLGKHCVAPRNWALDRTSSWLNFHLKRDHQTAAREILEFCGRRKCPVYENDGTPCRRANGKEGPV